MTAAVTAEQRADGRHARRERNRAAVVDALLALYREGNLDPTADQIAERSGVSARSLFRYFDDVDDLCRSAIEHQLDAVTPLFSTPIDPAAPLTDRIAEVVERRLRLYETVGRVGLISRVRAPFQPLIADTLRRGRDQLRQQLEVVFAAELERLGPERGPAALAAIDVLCSFESHELLRVDGHLDRTTFATTIRYALEELLTP